jgi:hypothetical protein
MHTLPSIDALITAAGGFILGCWFGGAILYTEKNFTDLINQNGIHHNSVLTLFRS